MTHNIRKLKEALVDHELATSDIEKLEAGKLAGKVDDKKYESAIAKCRKRLDKADAALAGARSAVRADVEKIRKTADDLLPEIAALERQQGSEGPFSDKNERELVKLRQELKKAKTQEGLLESAAGTASSKELIEIAARIDEEPTRDEEGYPVGRASYTDFPGMTVPERLILLFREVKKNPQTKRPIIISSAVIGAILLTLFGVLIVSGMRNDAGDTSGIIGRGDVLAPILVDGASNVGRLEITLTYDAEILTGLTVLPGSLASASMLEHNVSIPGTVIIELVDTTGITGSGELVIIKFRTDHIVIEPVPLLLSSASYDVHSLEEIPSQNEDGWVDTGNLSVMAPVIDFAQ
ncbi:MAG: hypothetical protein JW846_02105 [Dehalococcoidia bacterium]|nr:hypothetical protein [Dehalococcoidia bacterium]